MMDMWYLDDGALLSHPRHMVSYLQAFDARSGEHGASRNVSKTKDAFLMTRENPDLMQQSGAWMS